MTSNQQTQVACLLFSDLKGYSALKNDRLKNAIVQKMETIFELVSEPEVQLIKTMGDGLMAYSQTPLPLAATALRLRDIFKTTDWKSEGYPEDFLIRIGVHIDQAIVHYRDDGTVKDVIGTAVDTTARIEPVTPPNAVFCSKLFYDHLLRGGGKITGIAQGSRALVKQFGPLELFELVWTHEVATDTRSVQSSTSRSFPMPHIKKPLTDKGRKDYVRHAFGIIRGYFEEAAKQLQANLQMTETSIEDMNDTKFTCEIYLNGQSKARCKIWIGSLLGSSYGQIQYAEGRFDVNNDSAYNDAIDVVEGEQELHLRSSFGAMFAGRGPDTTKPSSPEQIAEYLWLRFTRPLEQ
ncbi:MAG TPA: adenylate/guanylate cyclase domain-containing protein [Bellilinea sp.]|nr:adenylate/guanylate cyclase domain-containing protein [Bellilinea sp.]